MTQEAKQAGSRAPGQAEDALADALGRARRHAARALAEGLAAARALLDAAALSISGSDAAGHPLFSEADAWIQRAHERLAGEASLDNEFSALLAAALDAEIERWEARARRDEDARAVLRAFLSIREVLWELGVRPADPGAQTPPQQPVRNAAKPPPPPPKDRPRRVERVAVQG